MNGRPTQVVKCACGYKLEIREYTNTCMCGCDKLFLVELALNVSAKSFAIEGQGEE